MISGREFRDNEAWRASFEGDGAWGIPLVHRQDLLDASIGLVAYPDTRPNDLECNTQKGVHFFVDDPRFEGIYKDPERSFGKLSQYQFLLTPDNSVYAEMKPWRQIRSVGESRWVGAYWQSRGLTVYPTISWGMPNTWSFCFAGVERHGTVAIATYACKSNKSAFMAGYYEMLRMLEPEHIICFGTPFSGMDAVDVVVDPKLVRRTVR